MKKLSIAMDASPAYVEIFDAYISYLSKNGLDIEVFHYSPVGTAIKKFIDGGVDMFWGGPFQFAIINHALSGAQLNPLAEDTDIDCHSVFITRADSDINSLDDLKGKTISTGPKYSAESRIIPVQYLREHGLEINKDYYEKNYDTQNEGIAAMMDGEVAAATSFYRNFLNQLASGVYMDWEVKVFAKTSPWDHCIFAAQPNLDVEKKEDYQKFVELMKEMDKDDPMVKDAMRMEGVNKWVEGRPDKYQLLLNGCEYLDVYKDFE